MIDPLAEVVTLLQPAARFSKLVHGASPWRTGRSNAGQPFYGVILEGGCRLAIDGHDPIELQSGDFVLIPAAFGVAMSSLEAPPDLETPAPVALGNGEFRIGPLGNPIDVRMMAGHCSFGSPDAPLLVSLLPQLVHVRGEQRLATLVQLVREESQEQRPAREVVLSRLLEVLLIEALRATAGGTNASPGLVSGSRQRARRQPPRGRDPRDARSPGACVERRRSRQGGRALALDLLRALQPCGRRRADGISAHLAHGTREGSAAPSRRPGRGDRGARRL